MTTVNDVDSLLDDIRRDFWDAWNGLSEVHTQEDLDAQSEKMWVARERLLKVDPEFRAMIKAREDKANSESDARRIKIQSRLKSLASEAEKDVAKANEKAKLAMMMTDADIDELVKKHRFKVLKHEEANKKSKLVCPICRGPDRGNIINGNPACFHCLHKLVPISELEEYNRQYRRKWKKSRKR